MAVLALVPLPAVSQDDGGGGSGHEGGGGGCGDVFGNLLHILRDDVTGQPIFAQRWIELPKEIPGYGWGYCPVAVDEDGERLPFLPFSCDIDPIYGDLVVGVDYFGRLNGGRTKERNSRMHFDEVISNIKEAGQLRLDPTGRLEMGFGDPDLCIVDGNPGYCSWSTIDSPMESMALYVRLMKYGHFATDPMEVDLWAKGDPAAGIQYHPALGESDWPKLESAGLNNLLPEGVCWDSGTFIFDCALPGKLEKEDINSAAVYLGAAANKTGKITVDLVQYLNRFLKITRNTEATLATADVLPALYEDCWPEDAADPWTEGDEYPDGFDMTTDLEYLDTCDILEANPAMPGWSVYAEFTNVKETFVNFSESGYKRDYNSDIKADLILEGKSTSIWVLATNLKPFKWVAKYPNPDPIVQRNIQNFVGAASDVLRAIEYIHNYAIPEDLYCKYDPSECL
ncbi:MAG: hypothetical protein WBS20_12065 [Lysobacterales bacterium]